MVESVHSEKPEKPQKENKKEDMGKKERLRNKVLKSL